MQKPFTHSNFYFRPKESFNVNKTDCPNSITYDLVISSILTQATQPQPRTQSYRILFSKENKKHFKQFVSQRKKIKFSPLKTKVKKKLELLTSKQKQMNNSCKLNGNTRKLLIQTKALNGINKQISKSSVKIGKQKSEATLKLKRVFKLNVLLLSPEKSIELTDNKQLSDLLIFNTQTKHIRKRNPKTLSKERERRCLENKLFLEEREKCLEKINHKIDSLYSTQDESRIQKIQSREIEDLQEDIPYISEVGASILNIIRAKTKRRTDSRRIHTAN